MNGPAPDPLLEAAVHYLSHRNFQRCRSYAVKAQSVPPLNTDATKILAISDVLAAGETRISETLIDWYAILHVYKYSQDTHLINEQFKKLSLLLYPQENKYPFAKEAFKLVCEAGSVLTNEAKKSEFDKDLQAYEMRLDESFWTICPYCYVMYEYVRVYQDCCLRCQNVKCGRGFHGFEVEAPPLDVVENGVYKCMGFFPLGFDGGKSGGKWNPFSPLVGVKKEDNGEDNGDGSGGGNANAGDCIDISDESDGLEDGDGDGNGGGGKDGDGDDRVGKRREVGGDDGFGGSVMKRRKKSVPINAKKLMGKGPRARRMENVGQEGLDLNARAGEDNAGGNSNGNEVPGVGGVEMGNGADFDAGVELLAGDDDIFKGVVDIFVVTLFTSARYIRPPVLQPPSSYNESTMLPGWHYVINSSLKSTTSEEASSGASQYNKEEADGVVMIEDVQRDEKVSYGAEAVQTVEKNDSNGAEGPSEESLEDEQFQPFEFLNKLNMELDSDSPYPLLVYGGSSLITLWLASAVVGSIDSIPVFPKLMEVVGLGYSVWFATRYLLFKKNRDELTAKIEEIKQEVLGSSDD
ncbi:hypothetical protein AgCh_014431 [Apium graveolens]